MSTTRLLVLGVVAGHGSMHGYAVRSELESWGADGWANVRWGSIYHALRQLEDCVAAAADELIAGNGGPVWDLDGFTRLLTAVRAGLDGTVLDVLAKVAGIVPLARRVEERLRGLTSPALAPAVADMKAQLSGLVYPGFVSAVSRRRLPDIQRYLRAMEYRLDKLAEGPVRDRERMQVIERLLARRPAPPVRWMIEELRVSLFAQPLGTPTPVSEQRILRAMEG